MNTNKEIWDLTKQPTRILLKWLNKARKCGFGYDPSENHGDEISIEDLKLELAKREHIPNKKEAKEIRKQKVRQ